VKKRKYNALGLTPRNVNGEQSESDDSVDEEAAVESHHGVANGQR
jgi:hypothetical protein